MDVCAFVCGHVHMSAGTQEVRDDWSFDTNLTDVWEALDTGTGKQSGVLCMLLIVGSSLQPHKQSSVS